MSRIVYIDPGKKLGWALRLDGKLIESGRFAWPAVTRVVYARHKKVRWVVERFSYGNRHNAQVNGFYAGYMLCGMGYSPKEHELTWVSTNQWGRRVGRPKTRELAKKWAVSQVRRRYDKAVSEDEAEAIMMGEPA